MTTLEECGIRYLTAASIQAYRESGAMWVLRYLFGKSDFRSPAFARSLALNAGMKVSLHVGDGRAGEDTALEGYDRQLREWGVDLDLPAARSEQDTILPMLELAVKALQQESGGLRRPIASGLSTSTFIGDVSTPFLSVPSFIFDDVQLHVKYTNRCPSQPRMKELMSMAIDRHARKQQCAVLYVTAKKYNWCVPTDEDLNYAEEWMVRDARALETFLAVVETPEHALAMVPTNADFYQWTPQLLGEAQQILLNYQEKMKCLCTRRKRKATSRKRLQVPTSGSATG